MWRRKLGIILFCFLIYLTVELFATGCCKNRIVKTDKASMSLQTGKRQLKGKTMEVHKSIYCVEKVNWEPFVTISPLLNCGSHCHRSHGGQSINGFRKKFIKLSSIGEHLTLWFSHNLWFEVLNYSFPEMMTLYRSCFLYSSPWILPAELHRSCYT